MAENAGRHPQALTFSLCMIVKNEEKVLARCLDSICDLMDEIIIVDTGSKDRTKEIASRYTELVYDFAWTGDFSQARNFSFSKATGDYIYAADADEVIDEENRKKFRALKESLLPGVEIVQMYYGNQLSQRTVYNFDRELRPKLFKRVRNFQWIEPVHETVRLLPVVYDSDIEITHLPGEGHGARDLQIFSEMTERGEALSPRLLNLYARELLISGSRKELQRAEDFFTAVADREETEPAQMKEALCVVVRAARERGDFLKMYRYAMKDVASEGVSEVCFELGEYYLAQKEYTEAALWFYNAAYETECVLNIRCGGDQALEGLARCYEGMGNSGQAELYRQEAREWRLK